MSDNNYATLQSIEKQQHKQTIEHERNASLHSIKIAALVKKAVRDVNSSNNKYKQQQKPQQQQQQNSGCIGDMYTGAKIVAQTIGKNCNTNCGTTTTNCGNNSCDEDTVVDNNTLNGALSTITEVSIEESIIIDSADSIMHSLADDDSFRRSLSPTPNRSGGGDRVRAVPVSPNSIEEDEGWQQKSIQWIDDVLPNLCSPVAQVCGGASSSLNNEPTPKRSYSRYYSNKGFCIPQDHEEPSTVPRTMSPQTTLAGTLSNDEETTTLPSIISDDEQEQDEEEEEDENDISVTLNNLTSISDHLLNKKQQQQDHQQVTHEKEGRLEERLQPSMYSYTNDTSSLSDYILKKQEEMQSTTTAATTATSIDNAGFPTKKRTKQQTTYGSNIKDELQCLDECLLNNKNIPCDEQKQDAITQFATSSVNILSYVMSPLVSGDICNTRYNGIISDKCSVCATTIGTNDDDTMTTIISEHTKKQMEVERKRRESIMKESMDMEITIDTAETQMFLMRLSNQIPSYDMADQSTTKSQIVEEDQVAAAAAAVITPICEALETLEEEESSTHPSSIQPAVVTPTAAGVNELYPTNSILQKQNTVLSDDSPDHTNVNLYQVFDDKSIKSEKVEEIVSSLSNESGTCRGSLSSPSVPPPPPALPFEQRKQLLKTNDNGMIDKGLLDVYNNSSSVSCRLGIAPVHSMDSQSVTDDEEEDDDHFYAPAYTPTAYHGSGKEKFGSKNTSSLSQMLIDTFHLVSVGDDDEVSDIKSYHTELLLGTTPKGKSVETQLSTVSGGGEDDDPVISTNCPHDEQQKDGINNLINRWEGMATPKQTNATSRDRKTYQSKQQELPPAMPEIKKKLDYNVPKKKKTTNAVVSAKEEEEKLAQIQNKISKIKKRQLPNSEASTPKKEKEKDEPKSLLDNDNTIQQQQQEKKTTAPSSPTPKPVWSNDRLKRAKMKRKERIRSRATS